MLKSINKVIKILIFSDVLLLTGFGLFWPIFAIFITDKIQGGSAEVAGFAMAFYWITKSIVQIPLGKYLDRNHGEKDDLLFIIIGFGLAGLAAFGYIFCSLPWHIYILQGIYGLGIAMNVAGWGATFTRHIDKGKEAFEWSFRSTAVGIGAGVSGALGGIIATKFGFTILFIGVGTFALLGALLPILIWKDIFPRDKTAPEIPETKTMPHLPKE